MKKSNSKEQAILSTAIRLFNQESYTAIGIDRIIAESGVSKMTVYKYFNSKENLIVKCLQFLHDEMKQSLLDQIKYRKSPQSRLERTYFWYMDLILDTDFKGDLFQKARTELLPHYPSIQLILDVHRDWFHQHTLALVEQLNLEEPESFTQLFISILEGMMSDSAANKEIIDPQKTWKYINTLIELEKN
ncbi:TetR/AcrR family transcriptional regulator [Acinetobacter pittii]|uniref:TetR/AcrR family transcriptional regulator n=1 Tax=Acinetobacter pittii TaxID=48296 RepID=UPI0024DE867D|nr:TetR/AcrR family transcriptional regulator [Acinetobacter pittii]